MTGTKKILIVIDPTATAQPALDRIAHFPRPLDAQLTLLICDFDPYLGADDTLTTAAVADARASVLQRHSKRLAELAQPLKAQGLDVLVEARWDYPLHDAIVRKAVEWGADLVVKDTHHHSALRRSIFSNTDWNLIRSCSAPVLLVKPRTIGHVPCVLAAVDPLHPRDKSGSLDDRILTTAKDFAHLIGGQTHVLHSFNVVPMMVASTEAMMMPIALPMTEMAAEIGKSHTEAVQALALAHEIPLDRVHVVQGAARGALVTSTEQLRADVLVMGAVSRSGLDRVFIGSTAEAVLDKLGCDVLIVKPAGFKSPT